MRISIIMIIGLLVSGCPRKPELIGSIVTENVDRCVESSSYTMYNPAIKMTEVKTVCNEYKCQAVTKKIAKYFWNDVVLNVVDIYSGKCL